MQLEVSLGLWQDRPADEVITTAALADKLGYRAVWIGEMATWDAFALGAHIGATFRSSSLVLGPFAVAVRDPMMIAMGAASVAAITGRPVEVALGTSSTVVVEGWHGRDRSRSGQALEESARAVRALLDGAKADVDGHVVRTQGYRLRLPAPRSPLVVAAFGPRALEVAATHADRLVLNLVDPTLAGELVAAFERACERIGRPRPRVALWAAAAVDPGAASVDQLRRSVVGYLAAPGYAEMFTRAGFGALCEYAATRPHPADLLARVPAELNEVVGLVGDAVAVEARMRSYLAAGVDDLVVVPSATDDDPAGAHTLEVLVDIAGRWAADGR
ncbi:MAG TPA: LLM class F420-dependent oxidoreductase [Jatrophihabitans sp.]|jgi:probable F420-dependent oxidoreductase|uniref:LLM class F420-dependent oxidoreductase n=1 Tax=Jatrophihabitans sp. TaxID=1932789 RepID=UPI002E012A70|nr:LLM class F420-dependent oxidoreductase [Jatrophihabitans sp.]